MTRVACILTAILVGGAFQIGCRRDTSRSSASAPQTATTDQRLTATPNPVPRVEGFGKTTIRWNGAPDRWVQVYVSENDQPERLFAQGSQGSQDISWIGPGSRYRFRMYKATEHTEVLGEIVVAQADRVGDPAAPRSATTGHPSLTATPNPVAADSKDDLTTVAWSVETAPWGQVYVAIDDGEERLFAQGPRGLQRARWIRAGAVYTFRLYEGNSHEKLLASIDVIRARIL